MKPLNENDCWMRGMFDSAAARYGLLNKILTFGQDEIWRQRAANVIEPHGGQRILDICTGTGDLALKIAKRFPDLGVYAIDYSPNMLAVAKSRAGARRLKNLFFKEGDCAKMEFENGYFDYVTISFGFRNLSYSRTNLINALKEVYRVLKKGGRFIIIETSQPKNSFVRKLFHFYAASVVPRTGRIFSGQKEPYAYLGSSIIKFFNPDKLMDILEEVGFKKENNTAFMFGAILLCVVQKEL